MQPRCNSWRKPIHDRKVNSSVGGSHPPAKTAAREDRIFPYKLIVPVGGMVHCRRCADNPSVSLRKPPPFIQGRHSRAICLYNEVDSRAAGAIHSTSSGFATFPSRGRQEKPSLLREGTARRLSGIDTTDSSEWITKTVRSTQYSFFQ